MKACSEKEKRKSKKKKEKQKKKQNGTMKVKKWQEQNTKKRQVDDNWWLKMR